MFFLPSIIKSDYADTLVFTKFIFVTWIPRVTYIYTKSFNKLHSIISTTLKMNISVQSLRITHNYIRTSSSPDIIMMFIGESGSGKSTCINYFANFFTGSSFTEQNQYSKMKILIPNARFPNVNFSAGNYSRHQERNVFNNTESQTQDCTAYDFTWNGQKIKVVDTPGFNDTNSNKDDENIEKVLKQAASLPFITAILITINGTNIRLSTSIKTTMNQLRGSLPDRVFKNLFFIFTNCDETTRNFNLSLIQDFNPSDDRIFHMQNSLFSIKDESLLKNKNAVRKMKDTWEDSVETMGDIMRKIGETSATSAQVFDEMRIRREQLVVHKENLIEKQKSLLEVMNMLDIEKERLKNVAKDKEENMDFKESKTIQVIELETKSYYSTICLRHGKVQVCHENCNLSYEPQLNLHHFKNCAAANGNNCRTCKCGMNDHLHSYEIPVSRYKTVEEIIQVKKAAFDQANKNLKDIDKRIKKFTEAQRNFQGEIDEIKNNLMKSIRELKQICSHFNFKDEMATTIQRLRKEARIVTNFKARQEFTRTADAIERLINELSF